MVKPRVVWGTLIACFIPQLGCSADGVSGKAIDTYELATETIELPVPTSRWTSVAAIAGTKTFPGTLDEDGALCIPDVPEGSYWLSLSSASLDRPEAPDAVTLIESSSRTLDLGTLRSHRPVLQPIVQPSHISATFLHVKDSELHNPGFSEPDPWGGDALWWVSSVVEAFEAAPFSLKDGGSVKVRGRFQAAPEKTISVDYRGSAFNQALAEATDSNPNEVYLHLGVTMDPAAQAPSEGATTSLLQLVLWSACPNTCNTPLDISIPGDLQRDFTYGNPFSGGQEIFSATLGFSAYLPVGSNRFKDVSGFVSVQMPASEISGTELRPLIGLPRHITVGGKAASASAVLVGVGETPVVAFEAPSFGKADFYRITAVDLFSGHEVGLRWERTQVLEIITTRTSVTVPSGVLENSRRYAFFVEAVSAPGHDPSRPFARQVREARAQMYTGVVIP